MLGASGFGLGLRAFGFGAWGLRFRLQGGGSSEAPQPFTKACLSSSEWQVPQTKSGSHGTSFESSGLWGSRH